MSFLKCKYCDKNATRYHRNHETGEHEHLCETHYARWHPMASINVRLPGQITVERMPEILEKRIQESELAQQFLNTPLREVYYRIQAMIGKPLWDQSFVLKCLKGFEQCVKVLDSDYDTVDLLTIYWYARLPWTEDEVDHSELVKLAKEMQQCECLAENPACVTFIKQILKDQRGAHIDSDKSDGSYEEANH